MASFSPIEQTNAARARLQQLTAAFLADGGQIRRCQPVITSNHEHAETEQRAMRLRTLSAVEGMSLQTAAKQMGLSYERARKICDSYCIKFKRRTARRSS